MSFRGAKVSTISVEPTCLTQCQPAPLTSFYVMHTLLILHVTISTKWITKTFFLGWRGGIYFPFSVSEISFSQLSIVPPTLKPCYCVPKSYNFSISMVNLLSFQLLRKRLVGCCISLCDCASDCLCHDRKNVNKVCPQTTALTLRQKEVSGHQILI